MSLYWIFQKLIQMQILFSLFFYSFSPFFSLWQAWNMQLIILIGSESIHGFVDAIVAKELKLPLVKATEISISVADGRRIHSVSFFPWFHRKIQCQNSWLAWILELESSDMMFDWMKEFNPILFDYYFEKVSFSRDGYLVTLQGMTDTCSL